MMTLPVAFYAEPRLRASSPGFERLKAAIELAPGTPETSLALAIDYYQTEAFSTKVERDEACGPTGHADIRYFPINRSALLRAGDTIDTIACGHDIDHPRFEQIFAPLFTAALRRQAEDVSQAGSKSKGVIATTAVSIARVRYTISVIGTGDWLNFDVSSLSGFEDAEPAIMDRTMEYLDHRLRLELSPTLIRARPN
jgi:hypothetical protein